MDIKSIGLLVEDSKELAVVKGEDRNLSLYFYDVVSFKPINLFGLTVVISLLDSDSSRVAIATSDIDAASGELGMEITSLVSASLKAGKQYLQVEIVDTGDLRIFFSDVIIDAKTPIAPLV